MLLARAEQNDPVKREWCASSQEMDLLVDANSPATGILLEGNRAVIENACLVASRQ